jgi:hypothetical protein
VRFLTLVDDESPKLKNLPEAKQDYRRRMKSGKHSRKDGWKETEEIDFNCKFLLSLTPAEDQEV